MTAELKTVQTEDEKNLKTYSYDEALQESIQYFNGDELAAKVFLDKYALKNDNQELVEKTPAEMHNRLANEFARIESKYPNPMSKEEIYDLLDMFKYIVPQGSPMSAIGNPYKIQTAGNCYVLDSPHDSYSGILYTDQQQAQLMKRRAGVGFDISTIRPKGLSVKNAAGTTDGIGVFMERFSNTCREVAQNGRRGALLLSVSVHHPDIRTFINIKRDKKKVTGANISIRLTDEFMKAVENNENFELRWPVHEKNPKQREMVNAKELWDEIIESAWDSAEPGLLFWDNMNKYSPAHVYGQIDKDFYNKSTNPCLTGDTLVYVADGRGKVSLEQLAKEGLDVPVFCYDDSGEINVRTMRNPRKTGFSEPVYKVHLNDGSVLKATKNHKFKLNDGSYTRVDELSPGDSLSIISRHKQPMPKDLNKKSSTKYYWIARKQSNSAEHRFVAEYHLDRKLKKSEVVHHKNFDGLDNSKSNLEVMSVSQHSKAHIDRMLGDNNPMRRAKHEWSECKWDSYRKKQSKASSGENNSRYLGVSSSEIKWHAISLSKTLERKATYLEWQEYAKKNNLPIAFSNWRKSDLGTVHELLKTAANILGYDCNIKSNVQENIKNAKKQGYLPKIINHALCVNKACEHCGKEFYVQYGKREQATCSNSCSNYILNKKGTNKKRKTTINKTYAKKAEITKESQLKAFTYLEYKLGRQPLLKEWEKECHDKNTSYRLKTKHGFSNYKELREVASNYNHRVVKVEFCGYEDVYNGTVDDYHNFFVGGFSGKTRKGFDKEIFVNTLNCGEIVMGIDSCRLLVVNLLSFVKNPFTKESYFDFDHFSEVVQKAQRLMDDVIDIELELMDRILNKIDTDPEPEHIKQVEKDLWLKMKETCQKGRRTGLGITALGDALAALNIIYGSKESIQKTEEIYKSLAVNAYTSSSILAKERGKFPIYNEDIERDHPFLDRVLESDNNLKQMHKKYGRRNIALTTTAPTGSVSVMTQTTSGIEPVYLLSYTRRRKVNSDMKNANISFVDELGDSWEESMVYHKGVSRWMEITGETEIEKSPYWGATSREIDWESSVDLQAAAQKYVCHSISKTCNLPNDVEKQVVANVYMRAWKSCVKGFTVYREGSRSGVLIENKEEEKEKTSIIKTDAPKRPKELPADVHHARVKGEEYFVMVGKLNDLNPYEVFAGKNGFIPKSVKKCVIQKMKRGVYDAILENGNTVEDIASHISEDQEAITRLVSSSLRHGADISFVVHQLEKTKGDLQSFAKAVSRCLKKHIEDGTKVVGESCPSCQGENMQRREGCKTCMDCGFSACG